jgi:hypothetical protein
MPFTTDPETPRTSGAVVWLADEDHFWPLLTLLLGAVASLKGLRQPGLWALTEALADYNQGFIKRGLLGAIYNALGVARERTLSISFFAELLLLLVLFAAFTRRSRLAQRVGTPAVVTLFAGSYVLTYLFHIVGYPDILNASILLALLLIRRARTRFLLALPLVTAGLLIHEAFLLLFAPVLLLSFYLEGLARPQERRRIWTLGLLLATLATAVTATISLRPALSPEQVDALADSLWNRADFVLREDFFQVFMNSLPGNLHMVSRDGWHQYRWWTLQAVSLFILGPALLLLFHFATRLIRQHRPATAGTAQQRWIKLAVLLAVLSPLSLHLIALDQVRWNTWVVVDAYLALGLLSMHLPGQNLRPTPAERNALILAIALGMASGYGLFDGAQINPYPFFPKAMRTLIQHHDHELPGFGPIGSE